MEELEKALNIIRNLGYDVHVISNSIIILAKRTEAQSKIINEATDENKLKIDITDPRTKKLIDKLEKLSPEKQDLLWRISMIYYKDRNLDKLKETLTKEEMKLIKELIDDKFIEIKSKGHLSLPKDIYEMTKLISYRKFINEMEYGIITIEDLKMFEKRKDIDQFIIFQNPVDEKFYVIKRELFEKNKDRILKMIKIPTHTSTIAEKTGLPLQMVKVILTILSDAGECIEESLDTYRRI